ncbi:hypothetical protein HDU67_009556 [Dinochytrium kinnereticum]|nr:hypothetical protein HDU67_009556 [Dinochytrium kinnereticum]
MSLIASEALRRLFYNHGIFCASHPLTLLTLCALLIFTLSWPAFNLAYQTLTKDAFEPTQFWESPSTRAPFQEEVFKETFGEQPFLRLEQFVINASASIVSYEGTGVVDKSLLLYVLELQDRIASVSVPGLKEGEFIRVNDICYKPFSDGRCLIHSPLEFWHSSKERLASDSSIVKTLSNRQALSSFDTPIPLHSIFGGISGSSTGSSRDFVIKSATSIVVTYFLEDGSSGSETSRFTSEVWDSIWKKAITDSIMTDQSNSGPIPGRVREVAWRANGEPRHLFYVFGDKEGGDGPVSAEYMILFVSYGLVFLYISLVLGRFELVKSKFGLGLGAVVMVICSLLTSVGLSSMMGVTTSLAPMEVFPFLIIAVGVENIFVLTNGVVTTSLDLPVKERVGLVSTINVPSLQVRSYPAKSLLKMYQEFCLFACIAIVMDFFLQITFFVTILAIDIRRLELSDLHTLQRMHTRRLSFSVDSPGQTEISADRLQRKTPWSAIVIGCIVVLLGLGFIGTSTDNLFQSDPTTKDNNTFWESSMSLTADAVWTVINPSKSNRYVEIRPPVHITIVHDGDPVPKASQPQPSDHHDSPPSSNWRIKIDTLTVEMTPSIFTSLVVTFLLLFTLSCIFITSLLYSFSKGRRLEPPQRTSAAAFLNSPYRIHAVNRGGFSDISLLATSKSDGITVWSDSDGLISLWHAATARLTSLRYPLLNAKRSPLSCLTIDRQWVVAGTMDGRVLLWDTGDSVLTCVVKTAAAVVCVKALASGTFIIALVDGLVFTIRRVDFEWKEVDRVILSGGDAGVFPACVHEISDGCVAVGRSDGSISLVEGSEETCVLRGHRDEIVHVTSDPSSGILASGSSSGDIILWDVKSMRQVLCIPHDFPESPSRLDQSNDDSDPSAPETSVDLDSRGPGLIVGHKDAVTNIVINPNQLPSSSPGWLTIRFVSSSTDHTVKIWSVTFARAGQLSLVDARCVKTIHGSGCSAMEVAGGLIVGARKASCIVNEVGEGNVSGCWEIWMCEMDTPSAGFRTIRVGEDLLSGILLPSSSWNPLRKFNELALKRKADSATRSLTFETSGSSLEVGPFPDQESSPVSMLPVFEINLLAVNKWGIACGFGNHLKFILFDASENEDKASPSRVSGEGRGTMERKPSNGATPHPTDDPILDQAEKKKKL